MTEKYHELTCKIFEEMYQSIAAISIANLDRGEVDKADKAVLEWLEEKAQKAYPIFSYGSPEFRLEKIREILGLSPAEKVGSEPRLTNACNYPVGHPSQCKCPPDNPVRECEHEWIFGSLKDAFCRKCGEWKPKDALMEQKVWCEHIQKGSDAKVYCLKSLRSNDGMDWNLVYSWWKCCPICGAKRPEPEKKALWEILAEVHRKTPHRELEKACKDDNHGMWKYVANAALDYFVELIENEPVTENMIFLPDKMFKYKILKRLEELRRG